MTTKNGKGPITAEQLQELKPLTAGDFYWGHKHADKRPDGTVDSTDLTVHTAHHAAARGGLAENHTFDEPGDDSCGFLDRVEFSDLLTIFSKDVTEEDSGPLAEPTGTSPPSVTTGT